VSERALPSKGLALLPLVYAEGALSADRDGVAEAGSPSRMRSGERPWEAGMRCAQPCVKGLGATTVSAGRAMKSATLFLTTLGLVGCTRVEERVVVTPSPVPTTVYVTATPSQVVSPTPTPNVEPSPAETEPPFVDLRMMKATIRNDVRDMFAEILCEEPSNDDLESWTSYVIRIGNRLQVKMPWQLALEEAEAKAFNELYETPYAEYRRDQWQTWVANGSILPDCKPYGA